MSRPPLFSGWQPTQRLHAPAPGRVDVWRLPVPGDEEVHALLQLLPEPEMQRAHRKRVQAKRFEYITGQAALRSVLAHALGAASGDIQYRRGPKGKPYLAGSRGGAEIAFNISHSGGQVLLALALGGEVGVNLEQVNPRTGCERVARRAFSGREQAQLSRTTAAEARLHFFRLWTCKEAVVKCTGDGIHSGMGRFSVDLAANGGGARISEALGNQRKVLGYHVIPLPVGADFAAALVHDGPRREVGLWQMDTATVLAAT